MQFVINDGVLLSCKGNIDSDVISIPESVTAIQENVFSQTNPAVKSLYLPSSLNSIGDCAFSGFVGLEEIVVPESNNFFYVRNDCLIEKGTNTLIFATTKCEKIPECEIIANWGARNIHTTKTIEIPESIKTVGRCAFRGADFYNIVFPEKSPQIGPYALADCHNLKFVTLPKDMTLIPHHMFCNDESLHQIDLPETLEIIDHCAFYNSGLFSLKIPKSVKYISDSIVSDEFSFYHIHDITFEDTENWYLCTYEKSYENALAAALSNKRKTSIFQTIDGKETQYNIIPADVTSPQNNATIISWYDLKYMVKR